MKLSKGISTLLGAVAVATGPAAAQPSGPEAQAARQIEERYIAAWKHADPAEIAGNFDSDGDFINPTGVYAHGRAAIAAFYAQAFRLGYKGSDGGFTARKVRQIRPGVVVVDGEWWIEGAHTPDGVARPRESGVACAIMVKTSQGWRISALREQASATRIQG